MIYNIPGVISTVEDLSNVNTSNLGGRSVLIVGFSKFGDENDLIEVHPEDVKYILGESDITRYGLGVEFILGALSVTGTSYFKRLLPGNATYANIIINKEQTIESKPNVIDKTSLISDSIITHIGKNRGDGYNEFIVKYSPAIDIEKQYADEEGDSKYLYNFLKVSIYRNTRDGLVTILPPTTISLIDIDPKDNLPIVDLSTGELLFINDRIPNKNTYLEININEEYLNDLKNYLSIDDLCQDKNVPQVILKDITTGINYKVKSDENNNLYLEATSQEGHDKLVLKYTYDGATNFKKIYVNNGKLENDVDLTVSDGYEELYIPGYQNFVKIFIDTETQDLKTEEFAIFRSNLYKQLLNNEWNLVEGSDGSIVINGIFNFNGPSESGAENGKTLLMNYFNNDAQIREVMYPKYTFNYIVDWTSDLDVIASIFNLTDVIGYALGIHSLPIAYNPDTDYQARTEKLYQSSYCNAIYSGQHNLKHIDSTGKIRAFPPSYYAMIDHLKIDNNISITEPVAYIEKAQLPVANVQLSYEITSGDIEKLRFAQINTIIKEKDGIYFIDQLTAYKKASKLSRINVVKVIQQMRIDIPKLLKPYVQRKDNNNSIMTITGIVENYMKKWKTTANNSNPDEIFESVNINTYYNQDEYALYVVIKVQPIGTIEKIVVPIVVV